MKPPRAQRPNLTFSVLHRMGYRSSNDRTVDGRFHFKRRLTRKGASSVVIQLKAVLDDCTVGGLKRGDAGLFTVTATETKVKNHGVSGYDESSVSTVSELREWEQFAICR